VHTGAHFAGFPRRGLGGRRASSEAVASREVCGAAPVSRSSAPVRRGVPARGAMPRAAVDLAGREHSGGNGQGPRPGEGGEERAGAVRAVGAP
jgi:hypothetical protein